MKELEKIISSGCIGRAQIDKVVDYVLDNPNLFPILHALTQHENPRTAHHAWWACEKLSRNMPDFFIDRKTELRKLVLSVSQEGVRRIVLNILYNLPHEEETDIVFLNYCLDEMLSPHHAPAVQALLLKHAFVQCSKESELLQEFFVLLEYADLDNYSPAVTSTVRNLLKKRKKH